MSTHRPPVPAEAADLPELPELLASFAENLSVRVTSGSHGDTFRREAEINQVLQALAAPLKGRVAIIGPARAGKTAVAHGLTALVARGECPPELRGKTIWALTPTSLPGLSARGNWRSVLDQLLNQWAQHPEIILYIDEITGAARLPGGGDDEDGNSVDVATVLATALKRLPGQCLVEAVCRRDHSMGTRPCIYRHCAQLLAAYGGSFVGKPFSPTGC